MGKRKTIGLILIVIAAAVTAASSYVALSPNSIEEATTVKIASFNIQILGKNKRQNEDVMRVLVRIVREFDLVLVQEIRDSSEQTTPIFLQRINEIEGPKYEVIRSERLGRTTSKEAYAYFYNTETIEFIPSSNYVCNDVGISLRENHTWPVFRVETSNLFLAEYIQNPMMLTLKLVI